MHEVKKTFSSGFSQPLEWFYSVPDFSKQTFGSLKRLISMQCHLSNYWLTHLLCQKPPQMNNPHWISIARKAKRQNNDRATFWQRMYMWRIGWNWWSFSYRTSLRVSSSDCFWNLFWFSQTLKTLSKLHKESLLHQTYVHRDFRSLSRAIVEIDEVMWGADRYGRAGADR